MVAASSGVYPHEFNEGEASQMAWTCNEEDKVQFIRNCIQEIHMDTALRSLENVRRRPAGRGRTGVMLRFVDAE